MNLFSLFFLVLFLLLTPKDAAALAANTPTNKTRVLSIDGGGIRGIIPLVFLGYIEKRTGCPSHVLFDVFAATSTGTIIATTLTTPKLTTAKKDRKNGKAVRYPTAAQILKVYEREGKKVFSHDLWWQIKTLWGLNGPLYPDKNFNAYLKNLFGNATLADIPSNILITAFDLYSYTPVVFSSTKARQDSAHNFYINTIIRGATAAESYFAPLPIKNIEKTKKYLPVDAGIYVNNPLMLGIAEVQSKHPNSSYQILSLGTGRSSAPSTKGIKSWGLVSWLKHLVAISHQGQSHMVHKTAMEILSREDPIRYGDFLRLEVSLPASHMGMADASAKNIKALKQIAQEKIKRERDKINAFIDRLLPPPHVRQRWCTKVKI